MPMGPGLRKFTLAAHLTFSVGWTGTVVAYLALGVSAVTNQDALTVRAAWIAMELIGWNVIVPLALASNLTGLVMALGTPWGLFRHYWVLISLVLTVLSTIVLLDHMPTVSSLAAVAREADDVDLAGGLGGDLFHPGVGLLVLLVITVLNVYKPRGLTRYGWRKQEEERRRISPAKMLQSSSLLRQASIRELLDLDDHFFPVGWSGRDSSHGTFGPASSPDGVVRHRYNGCTWRSDCVSLECRQTFRKFPGS